MAVTKRVAIVGIGTTAAPGKIHPEKSWKEIVADAAYEAMQDAGMKPKDIDGACIGYHGEGNQEQGGIGGSVTDLLGIAPAPTFPTSMNCSGGTVSLNTGYEMVASGKYKHVLVMGFDKEGDNLAYTENINISFDTEYDFNFGFRHRDGFELMSRTYMRKYGYNDDYTCYAAMAHQAHWYARRNPKATFYGTPMPEFESLKNANSCMSVMGEGCAAAILVPEEEAYKYSKNPVWIDGITLSCTSHYIAHRYGEPPMGERYPEGLDMKDMDGQSVALIDAARRAYKMAGITPSDIDVAEVYDLTAGAFWFLDGLGITEYGKGAQFFIDGETAIDGKCPVNTDGGNIARGHASGADGLNMVIEGVVQLRGEGGERQVKDPKCAACACVGSAFAHMTVTVLTNDKFERKN